MLHKITSLDVRTLPQNERSTRIFKTFDELYVGEILELINNHNPVSLQYEFMNGRKGRFEWKWKEKGTIEWIAMIKKTR